MTLFDPIDQGLWIQRVRDEQMREATPEKRKVLEASAKAADDTGARFCGGVMIVAAPFMALISPKAGVDLAVKGTQTLFSKEPQKVLNQSALGLATDAAKAEVSSHTSSSNNTSPPPDKK